MQLDILNKELVEKVEPTFDISFDDIYSGYFELFKDFDIDNINIVFVKSEYIHNLNMKYRGIDAPTDVLSFEISDIKKGGEIYISPEYVYENFKNEEFEEEILRLIIHGTLHILGYDHSDSMDESLGEEIFKIQEELLLKYKKICS